MIHGGRILRLYLHLHLHHPPSFILHPHDDVIKWKHFPRYWPFVLGNSPVPGEFPTQRPVTRSFDVFLDVGLNKRLSKQSKRWWFEAQSSSLWRHRYAISSRHLHPPSPFLYLYLYLYNLYLYPYLSICHLYLHLSRSLSRSISKSSIWYLSLYVYIFIYS